MSPAIGTRLFVSRLSFFTTIEHLKKLFSPFGKVTEASLPLDPRTNRPKGFGFISYLSETEAEKAMKAMNGRIVDGRLILVEPANPRSPSSPVITTKNSAKLNGTNK